MIGLFVASLPSALAGLQAGARARGLEWSAANLRNMAYLTYEGTVPPVVIQTSDPCSYCGVEDFAHNQCNRCGAVR
jgi:hypothetical protein